MYYRGVKKIIKLLLWMHEYKRKFCSEVTANSTKYKLNLNSAKLSDLT